MSNFFGSLQKGVFLINVSVLQYPNRGALSNLTYFKVVATVLSGDVTLS
jgi:hypothetical protein